MVIYFPVSALVTIFANVLQNPQDARARSDIRLMHQVVSFLSVLAVDEETGGVKRMLEVCQEFERIAKIVLEKAEKDSHSRRKRKAKDEEEPTTRAAPERRTPSSLSAASKSQTTAATTPSTTTSTSKTLTPNYASQAAADLSAPMPPSASSGTANPTTPAPFQNSTANNSRAQSAHSPNPPVSSHQFSSPASQHAPSPAVLPEYVTRPGDWPNPYGDIGDINHFVGINSPLNMGATIAPQFAGQDLWNMPMSFDWDWHNMQADGNAPENGVPMAGNMGVNGGPELHHQ